MTQVFSEDGTRTPVTALQVGPCRVVQVKTAEKDGYLAVQIGYGTVRRINKASTGHQKGQKFGHLKEFRVPAEQQVKIGDEITVSAFKPGSFVNVSGVMKGRGFAGVMKRHGFHGFPASHGHDHPRQPGAIGGRYPQHTIKGMRMAGHMGSKQVTVKNLEIIDIDPEQNIMWVKGAIPGSRNKVVKIVSSDKTAVEPRKLAMTLDPEKKAHKAGQADTTQEEKPASKEEKVKEELPQT